MIDYQTFQQIRQLPDQEHLSAAQIAQALHLDERTVSKWIECPTYQPRARAKRPSKLDPYKGMVVRLLAIFAFSAQQLFQRLRESGYTGGYTILKDYVCTVRPPRCIRATWILPATTASPSRLAARTNPMKKGAWRMPSATSRETSSPACSASI